MEIVQTFSVMKEVYVVFETKSLKCLANQSNIRYYECGEHNLDEEARADEPRAHHGCTSKVKELIETIIFEHNIIQPKKVSKYLYIFFKFEYFFS